MELSPSSRNRWPRLVAPLVLAGLALVPVTPIAMVAALLLFVWCPGAAAARLLGLDRAWRGTAFVVIAGGLSVALTPVALDAIWRFANQAWVLVGAIAALCVCLEALALRIESSRRSGEQEGVADRLVDSRSARVVLLVMSIWVALAIIGPYWPVDVGGAPIPSLIHDFIKHHAVLLSMERSPLPLHSPFFAAGQGEPVYYYHYFYLIPASVRACAPSVPIQLAFAVQAKIVALLVAGLAALLVRGIRGGDAAPVLAFALMTVVGGLDAIPLLLERTPAITLDTWADPLFRIHSLLTQMVWTPQNVQGLLILLTAAVVASRIGFSIAWIGLAPLLIASLIGATIWVAAAVLPAVVIVVALWLWDARRTGGLGRRVAAVVATAGLAGALAAPQLSGYAEMSKRHTEAGLTLSWPRSESSVFDAVVGPGPLANLLDLSWRVPFEFGALAVLPLLVRRETWGKILADPGGRLLATSGIVGLIAFILVRSNFTYNDFGQKVIFPSLAAGAVIGACIVRGRAGEANQPLLDIRLRGMAVSLVIVAVLVAGLPVSVFQSPLAAVRRFIPPHSRLGRLVSEPLVRAREEASLVRFLRDKLPVDAVIQPDWRPDRLDLIQRCNHGFGVTELERDTMVFQPADVSSHGRALALLRSSIEQGATSVELAAAFREIGASHVVVGKAERARWPHLERFSDASKFEFVFSERELAVYQLHE